MHTVRESLHPILVGAPWARDVIAQGKALGQMIGFELSAESAECAPCSNNFALSALITLGAETCRAR